MAGSKKSSRAASEEALIEDDLDDELESQRSGIPDIFRKMMAMGFSGLFTTEAAVRGALGDSVPREWVDFVSQQSERTREEFAQRLAEELGRVLEDVDLAELVGQLLEGRTVEVKAEFRLAPRDGGTKMSQTETRSEAPGDAQGTRRRRGKS